VVVVVGGDVGVVVVGRVSVVGPTPPVGDDVVGGGSVKVGVEDVCVVWVNVVIVCVAVVVVVCVVRVRVLVVWVFGAVAV
jgi:hypothetical protein